MSLDTAVMLSCYSWLFAITELSNASKAWPSDTCADQQQARDNPLARRSFPSWALTITPSPNTLAF